MSDPPPHLLLAARSLFVESVAQLQKPPSNFSHALLHHSVAGYQQLDPTFKDLLAIRHAFTLLKWIYTTDTLTHEWRQKFLILVDPFVRAQRSLVGRQGPNFLRVAERLRKLGILEEPTSKSSGGDKQTSSNASSSRANADTRLFIGQKRSRPEEKTKEEINSDDEIIFIAHRKPKDVRVAPTKSEKRPDGATYRFYRGNDRCLRCIRATCTPCKIKDGCASCERCRMKKVKCIRASSDKGKNRDQRKGRERERESSRPMLAAMEQTLRSVVEQLPQNLLDSAIRGIQNATPQTALDPAAATGPGFQSTVPASQTSANPLATAGPSNWAGTSRSAETAPVLVRPQSRPEVAQPLASGSHVRWDGLAVSRAPARDQAEQPFAFAPLPTVRPSTSTAILSATRHLGQSDKGNKDSSDAINAYFQLAKRYASIQARHFAATNELLQVYEELMTTADKLAEPGELPQAFYPASLIKHESSALLVGSQRYRKEHPDLWKALVKCDNDSGAGTYVG